MVADEEFLPFGENTFDLVVSSLRLGGKKSSLTFLLQSFNVTQFTFFLLFSVYTGLTTYQKPSNRFDFTVV